MTWTVISFIGFLALFLAIGILSMVSKRHTTADYLLAGSTVPPWLVALSAVATNNSGYMFIGMIGFTYATGLSSIWLMIGWILGDALMSYLVHPRLRTMTEKRGSLSFSETLGRWQGTDFKWFRKLSASITILFLVTYAAAQFKAGSKALHVLFGWDYHSGAIIGAAMVLMYCFSGGIRASIWTDAAQSAVMIVAMSLLMILSIDQLGGWASFWSQLHAVSSTYMSLFPSLDYGVLGLILFLLGWFFAGIAVIGQPHIMVRFMTMNSVKHMTTVRAYYYTWYTLFYLMTIGVGLAARLFVPMAGQFDSELALPTMAIELLPAILVGLVLAGLFAASMSTADSQLLSCTAALTRDLIPAKKDSIRIAKLTTIVMTSLALMLALAAPTSVFNLVLIAWSGLASAFAPLLILLSLRYTITERQACLMTITGLLTVYLWHQAGLNRITYDVLPGIVSGFIVYFASIMLGRWIKL